MLHECWCVDKRQQHRKLLLTAFTCTRQQSKDTMLQTHHRQVLTECSATNSFEAFRSALCRHYVPMWKLSFGSIQLTQIICLANLSSRVFVSFMHTFTATSLGPHLCCWKAIVNKFCWCSRLHDILDGVMSFATAGPQLWNSLPAEVRSASSLTTFCQSLKTHLFPKSYPDIVL